MRDPRVQRWLKSSFLRIFNLLILLGSIIIPGLYTTSFTYLFVQTLDQKTFN